MTTTAETLPAHRSRRARTSTPKTHALPRGPLVHTEPAAQHRWLHQLVGEWAVTSEYPGPDGKPHRSHGREVVRHLGDLWIVSELEGEMPGGGTMRAMMTIGFDLRKGRFVGTWVGSPMAHIFAYEGDLDPSGTRLALECEGPAMCDPSTTEPSASPTAAPALAWYQDAIELRSRTERRLISSMRGPDGTWTKFMEAVFTRTG
jgi:hypothetical protein